jgi:hypothetical protein
MKIQPDWIQVRPGVFKNPQGKICHLMCQDCKEDRPTSFMVKDDIWVEAGMKKGGGGTLCFQCFELRLGREVESNELSLARVNDLIIAFYLRGVEAGKRQAKFQYESRSRPRPLP